MGLGGGHALAAVADLALDLGGADFAFGEEGLAFGGAGFAFGGAGWGAASAALTAASSSSKLSWMHWE